MIEVSEVSKKYGRFVAVEAVSLAAETGSVYGLVGYNGAGKTTLLKVMAGIFAPDSGRVTLNACPVDHAGRFGDQVFMVTDDPYYFPQATPMMMRSFYRGYYQSWSDAVFLRLLDLFELDSGAKIGGFSKGMQRQAALASALASGSACLLLDESFDGLDLGKRRLVASLVRKYAAERESTVVLSSHTLRDLEGFVDRVGMIEDRRLLFDLDAAELHRRYRKYQVPVSSAGGDLADLLGRTSLRWLEQRGDVFVLVADSSAVEALAADGWSTEGLIESDASLEEIFMRRKHLDGEMLDGVFAT